VCVMNRTPLFLVFCLAVLLTGCTRDGNLSLREALGSDSGNRSVLVEQEMPGVTILSGTVDNTNGESRPDSRDTSGKTGEDPAAGEAATGKPLATQVATRPFFVPEPLQAGQSLPQDRISRAEFPEIQLSDALLYLLRQVTLRLSVDEGLTDRTLYNVVLEGNFDAALDALARKGEFSYRRQGDVLTITSAVRYRMELPPVGYVGPRGHTSATFALDPFAALAARLTQAGAQDVKVEPNMGRIVFSTSVPGREPIFGVVEEWREQEEMVAWKLSIHRLRQGPLMTADWATFSPDLKVLPLDDARGTVRAYTGTFDDGVISGFLDALDQKHTVIEQGVVLLPENLPVTFSPASSLCPADKKSLSGKQSLRGKAPTGKTPRPLTSKAAPKATAAEQGQAATLTLQSRRDSQRLRSNLTLALPGCPVPGSSMGFTVTASQSVVLVGAGGDLVLVLEPRLIRFGEAQAEDGL
jgi:hypothetical protein